jgi:hypothetical protein
MRVYPIVLAAAGGAGLAAGTWYALLNRRATPEQAVYSPPSPSRDHRVNVEVADRYALPHEDPRY